MYLDANKRAYERYYELLLDHHMLSVGGMLVADNVLFRGMVCGGDAEVGGGDKVQRRLTKIGRALDAFNRRVEADPRMQQVLLPMEDGVLIARRNK